MAALRQRQQYNNTVGQPTPDWGLKRVNAILFRHPPYLIYKYYGREGAAGVRVTI